MPPDAATPPPDETGHEPPPPPEADAARTADPSDNSPTPHATPTSDAGTPAAGPRPAPDAGAPAPDAGVPGAGAGQVPPSAPPGGPGWAPPPGGWAPPPGTDRRLFVRTRESRIIAGVCGGLARATGTDPILFRVVLAVLAFFGGIGLVLYLAAWLLLPAEGDTAAPLEALFGRGRSSTSSLLTVVLGIGAVVGLAVALNSGLSTTVLLVALVVGIVLLMRRGPAGPVGPGGPVAAVPGAGNPYPPAGPPSGGGHPAPGAVPYDPGAPFHPAPAAPTPATWAAATAGATATAALPQVPPAGAAWSDPPGATRQEGFTAPFAPYRAPFAPHGPYAPHSPPVPPRPTPPPRPPKERSILGRLTFSLVCFALAVLAIVDVSGADVAFTAYPALALTVVALGMLVGAWFGRARWLIALGIVAGLVLGAGAVADQVSRYESGRTTTYAPATFAELQDRYYVPSGHVVLDLRRIDFTGKAADVQVEVGAGEVDVLLPPSVDVEVASSLGSGHSRVLGSEDGGVGLDNFRSDLGPDGAGGGELRLNIEMGVGDLEVTR